jgi:hypothetical protein
MNQKDEPYEDLSRALRLALGNRPQKELVHACAVNAADISHALKGSRALSLSALERVAKYLRLDFSRLVLLKTIDELRHEGRSEAVEELERVAGTLAQQRSPAVIPETFLGSWQTALDLETVVAADRREQRPVSYADCLALSGSVGDLFYLPTLGLPPKVRIRSDKIIKLAERDKLRTLLSGDMLVTGSPSANYATRAILTTILFPFMIEAGTIAAEHEIAEELHPIRLHMPKLAAFMSDQQNARKLNNMLNGFSRPGFVDPIAYIQARGSAPRSSMDFGIITLAKNPWAEDRLAIVAAGVHGPATAGALQLLTRKGAFARHPFGGVFSVSISNVAHWEDRYDWLDPQWDTHEYSISEYEEALCNRRVLEVLPNQSNQGQLEVLEIVKRRCREAARSG